MTRNDTHEGTTMSEATLNQLVADAVNDVKAIRIKRGNATKILVSNLVEDGIGIEAQVLGGKRAERNDYVVVVGFIAEDGFLRVIVDGTRKDMESAQTRVRTGGTSLCGWWATNGKNSHIVARVVEVAA